MKKTLAALALVSGLATAQVQMGPAGGVESKILALELAWNQAEERSDTRALDMIFANSMVYINEEGAMLTKSQFLSRVKQSDAHLLSLSTQNVSVHLFGDTAVIGGQYRARGVDHGKPYLREGRFIDIWVLEKGNWACVAAQSTPLGR